MVTRAPLWLDRPRADHPQLTGTERFDVVVVGGGLAGLLTGLLLARSGVSVAVLEARRIGDGASGHSTAKVSLLQGTRMSRILRSNATSVLRDYIEANREGQAWLRRFCEDHDVAFQERDAYTYATTESGEALARAELGAARHAGLDVTWETESELPFPVLGAVRLADQFQLDPMELMNAIISQLLAAGASLFEGSRVTDVRRHDDEITVETNVGTAVAESVVLATNQPILRKHGFFARLRAARSYAIALDSPWTPHGMYLSCDRATRSLRSTPVPDADELLLVGGNGHVTGRESSPQRRLDELVEWAVTTFPGSKVSHTWSAQDQTPATGLPYVGPMLPRDHSIWVATGFDKWGFTNAPAAALLLSKSILARTMGGEPPAWGRALSSWTPRELAAALRTVTYNAEVGAQIATGFVRPIVSGDNREGEVSYEGIHPVARADIDGEVHRVSAACPHLGGIVRWNDAERSWDCPLHGSRFAPDGSVLEGPAVCGLRKL